MLIIGEMCADIVAFSVWIHNTVLCEVGEKVRQGCSGAIRELLHTLLLVGGDPSWLADDILQSMHTES